MAIHKSLKAAIMLLNVLAKALQSKISLHKQLKVTSIFVAPNRRLSALRTYPLVAYLERCIEEALEQDFAAFFRAYLGPSWQPSWRW